MASPGLTPSSASASRSFAWSGASPGTIGAAVSQAAEGVLKNGPEPTTKNSCVMGPILFDRRQRDVAVMSVIMDGSQTGRCRRRCRPAEIWWQSSGNRRRARNPIRQLLLRRSLDITATTNAPDGITVDAAGRSAGHWPHPPTAGWSYSAGHYGQSDLPPSFVVQLAVQPTIGDTFLPLRVDSAITSIKGFGRMSVLSRVQNCSSSTVTFANPGSTLVPPGGWRRKQRHCPGQIYNLSRAATSPRDQAVSTQDDGFSTPARSTLYRCSLTAGCVPAQHYEQAVNGCAAPAQVAPAQHAIATPRQVPTSASHCFTWVTMVAC